MAATASEIKGMGTLGMAATISGACLMTASAGFAGYFSALDVSHGWPIGIAGGGVLFVLGSILQAVYLTKSIPEE